MEKKRKIIQIIPRIWTDEDSLVTCSLVALCDDGTIWNFNSVKKEWNLYTPPIPDKE